MGEPVPFGRRPPRRTSSCEIRRFVSSLIFFFIFDAISIIIITIAVHYAVEDGGRQVNITSKRNLKSNMREDLISTL